MMIKLRSHSLATPKPAEPRSVTVAVPPFDLDQIDQLVRPGFYANRGDFVRSAIRAKIAEHAQIATSIVAAMPTPGPTEAAKRGPAEPVSRDRLLELLRCPSCGGRFLWTHAEGGDPALACTRQHTYPVIDGIPRLLNGDNDHRSRQSFGREWAHHRLGDPTWHMDTAFRVGASFLHPLRIPPHDLASMTVLDVGCGNGSQSVAYAQHVNEVIAIDLSSGVELGHALLHQQPDAPTDRVHFVQADLHHPPLPPASVDVIHAHGVLHHTPDTHAGLKALVPLLRPGGTMYVWLYSDGFVTPRVRRLRQITTRLPVRLVDVLCGLLAPVLVLTVKAQNTLRLRSLPPMSRRAAALTLLDVLGPPYMHHHTVPEVTDWFADLGFSEIWSCLHSRRGFAVCGRLPADVRLATTRG
jgi:SAM-dependent methyltransferase/Arc/MetJ-type ribon-helix-helix transcriptional regulator